MSERQKLVAATFLVNARNAARRAAMPRPSPQPRGSEESRFHGEIHERVDLQHEITCSTFSRRMGITVGLLGLLRSGFRAQGVSEKLRTALS